MIKNGNAMAGFTVTSEGYIPHKPHTSGKFLMPVVINFNCKKKTNKGEHFYPPMRDKKTGDLVYALPGGGFFVDTEGSKK